MSTIRNLSLRVKLFGGFGIVVGVMVLLVGAALLMQSQMATATDHITGTATPKAEAGHDIKFAASDLVGWQEANVMDMGHSRAPFLHAAAMFRHRLQHLHDISVAPQDALNAKAVIADFTGFMQVDGRVWAAVQGGDSATATRIALGPASAAYEKLIRATQRYLRGANADAAAAGRSFQRRRAAPR